MTEPGEVLAYLEGEGPDSCGRSVLQVLAANDASLETTHDFIQWLFPLTEVSDAVPDSPVLAPEEVGLIRQSDMAQCALAAGTDRMRLFYQRTHGWMMPNNHNHRRITRIIRSLRLLRGDQEANDFRHSVLALVEAARAPINARSRGYWETA